MDTAELLQALHNQTTIMSSTSSMARTPAFRELHELGQDAVPALIEDLRAEPSIPVLMLLSQITGESPFADHDRGWVQKMAKAWLDWYDEKREDYEPGGMQITEAARRSMNRVAKLIHNRTVGIITGHRKELSAAENNKRNEEIKAAIKAHGGLGYIPIRGRYIEGYGTKAQKEPSDERSFMIMSRHGDDSEMVRNFLLKHAPKYDQESVLYKHRLEKNAELIGTRAGGYPGLGKVENVGRFHPNRAAEFHSLLTRGPLPGKYPKKPGQIPAQKKPFSFTKEGVDYMGAEGLFEDFRFVKEITFLNRSETF